MEVGIDINEPLLSIGVVAKMFNVSVQTLRLYESKGLIIPFKKDSNHRLYSQNDLNRLKCIRKLITELKFSIESIRIFYSMIPCWSIVGCSIKDRENCKAFEQYMYPCWSFEHKNNVCSGKDCSICPVYTEHSNCLQIKKTIKEKTINNL